LTSDYRRHRAAIDKTVALANKEIAVVETVADATLEKSLRTLWIAAIAINLQLFLLTYFGIRSIMRPISKLTTYANHVAEDDYECT